MISSIIYIQSSVISSNTFIQSSNTNTSSISSIVTAVEICDEVGFLQSATHVYLKKLGSIYHQYVPEKFVLQSLSCEYL